MKSTIRLAAGLALTLNMAHAQVRQPAPTGQVPKSYSGVQSAPAGTYKPKPTGQIAPEAPGQLGTIVQPAPAATPAQKVSDVQDLGFEVNSRPSTTQGAVPKVNTSQDPRTMRERYQPEVVQQPGSTSGQVETVQPAQGAGAPAGSGTAASGTYAPGAVGQGGVQGGGASGQNGPGMQDGSSTQGGVSTQTGASAQSGTSSPNGTSVQTGTTTPGRTPWTPVQRGDQGSRGQSAPPARQGNVQSPASQAPASGPPKAASQRVD